MAARARIQFCPSPHCDCSASLSDSPPRDCCLVRLTSSWMPITPFCPFCVNALASGLESLRRRVLLNHTRGRVSNDNRQHQSYVAKRLWPPPLRLSRMPTCAPPFLPRKALSPSMCLSCLGIRAHFLKIFSFLPCLGPNSYPLSSSCTKHGARISPSWMP